MNTQALVSILGFYGVFLICCGIASVIFIGMKAKTALISGGMAGSISLLIAYLIHIKINYAQYAGLGVSFALFCVFAWRCTLTFFSLFSMIRENNAEAKGKAIAFLIIALMAVMSMVVFALQIVFLNG